MESLQEKTCQPCEGGVPPLTAEEIKNYRQKVSDEWEVIEDQKISRTFKFKNFKQALDFANQVGEIAEEENHHPDLHVYYGKAVVDLTTHAIGGLSENDFIMAAKVDEVKK